MSDRNTIKELKRLETNIWKNLNQKNTKNLLTKTSKRDNLIGKNYLFGTLKFIFIKLALNADQIQNLTIV